MEKKIDSRPVKKSHNCQICDKPFITRSHLELHIRIHSDIRPFQREVCEKSFIQKGHLKSHIMTHTEEKPFVW